MRILRWVAILLTVSLLATVVLAQDTGSLTGSVKDPSGAAIANAQVTVSDPVRGITRQTTTNGDGEWLAAGLPGGSYDVSITAPNFKGYNAKGVVLRVGQKLRADATMQVGAASTEITVEGQNVAQVETQTSDLAGTVNSKQISQLQLNGRNFTQLATLVPGVSNQTGQDEGTVGVYGNVAMSFNGGRTEYNNWELDGGDNMDNGSNATLNVYPSIDAIAEVRVLTSNYGAQYGRNGSGTVETETKSGTSSFHGDVYEFVRNDMFNARNYFDPFVDANGRSVGSPAYKKNDYGYTIGGPVYIPGVYNKNKDKTFFFWSQEWRKDVVPGQTFSQGVPSVAERGGNFSDLCPNPVTGSNADCPIDPSTSAPFPGNQVPVDPNTVAFLQQIPLPTSGVPGAELFNASPTQPTNWREELIRVDHNFSPKIRGMFRYIHDSWDTITPVPLWTNAGSFPTNQTNFKGPGVSLVTRLTATVSPTLLNEFVFSYTADHIILNSVGAWQRPAGLTMGALFQNGFQGKAPGFTLTAGDPYGGGFGQDAGSPVPEGLYNSNPTYTFRDNITKIVARHNLQFGAYAAAAQKNELGGGDLNGFFTFDPTSPVSTGNAFSDLLTGRIATYQQTSQQVKFYNRYKILEPYFQDDWRVTDRLTLNLGLRASLYGTYRERYKNAFNWDPGAYDPARAPIVDDANGTLTGTAGALVPGSGDQFDGLVHCGFNGVPVSCQKGHLFNPAPRIGFAYDPTGNGRTAIRGGYGIFFEHTNGNEATTESLDGQSSTLIQSATQNNVVGYTNVGSSALGLAPAFPLSFISIPNKVQWPYMQQWHLDVQHEFPKNTVATFSYVASKGTHLGRQTDLNQINAVPLSQNPYKPGEFIGANGHDDCGTNTTPSGVPVTGDALVNLRVACGDPPDFFRPFRGASSISRLEPKASSIYHGFQTSVRHTVGSLQLNLAYTFSHSIDDSSDRYDSGFADSYHPGASRASSQFDQRHMLNIGYVYDLPFFRQPGIAHTILGGWEYGGIATWQTGTPFTPTNSCDSCFSDNAGVANGNGTSSYPDLVGDPNALPSGSLFVPGVTGPLLYNPAAYTFPRGLTFGNAGRDSLRNPNRTNFDMSLYKHFAIKERAAFEFRAEAFNIFNNTQWNGVNSGFGGNDFLHPSGAHRSRILQLGLKFLF